MNKRLFWYEKGQLNIANLYWIQSPSVNFSFSKAEGDRTRTKEGKPLWSANERCSLWQQWLRDVCDIPCLQPCSWESSTCQLYPVVAEPTWGKAENQWDLLPSPGAGVQAWTYRAVAALCSTPMPSPLSYCLVLFFGTGNRLEGAYWISHQHSYSARD